MAYSHRREPIAHTCPDIDKIQGAIMECEKLSNSYAVKRDDEDGLRSRLDDIEYKLSGLVDKLEKLRSANSSLREGGIDEAQTVDTLKEKVLEVEVA